MVSTTVHDAPDVMPSSTNGAGLLTPTGIVNVAVRPSVQVARISMGPRPPAAAPVIVLVTVSRPGCRA